MLVVAISCVAFGSWQIARYEWKHDTNSELRRNNGAPIIPLSQVLPLVGKGTPNADTTEYRRVTVTGTYDATHETLVRGQVASAQQGFYILTPLRISSNANTTDATTILVVRGLLPARNSEPPKSPVPAPPTTEVTLTGSVRLPDKGHDGYGQLPADQVESVSPTDQAGRLQQPLYNGYLQLDASQPGTTDLIALDAPDLSNPAGGAVEPQHFAYIVQWYLFAMFALAAPWVMARSELKREGTDNDDSGTTEHDAEGNAGAEQAVIARKLADRYGN